MPKSRRGQHLLSTFKALDKKLDAHHVIVAEKSATVSVRLYNEYGQKIKTVTELHNPSATAQLTIVVIPPNKFLNPNPSRIANVKYREIQQQMMLLEEQKHDGLFPIVRNEVELELPQ